MLVDEVQQLPDKNRVKHVLYYTRCARFELLDDIFLTQLKSIRNRHQESYTSLCQLLKNPVLRPLHLILYKDRQFVTYIEKYSWAKNKKKINKLISSPCLRKQAAHIFSKSFKSFLYVEVDKKYGRHTPFT